MEPSPAPSSAHPANVNADNSPEPPAVPTGQLALDLKIVSPSISQPISIPEIAAASTVGQVKDKIRTQLPARYSGSTLRLICRGRMLNRDDETLLSVFGEDLVSWCENVCFVHAPSNTFKCRSVPRSILRYTLSCLTIPIGQRLHP